MNKGAEVVERKLSSQFYDKLILAYQTGAFSDIHDEGWLFTPARVPFPHGVSWFWSELYRVYPETLLMITPEVVKAVPELREFCDKLEAIANSPLVKALG